MRTLLLLFWSVGLLVLATPRTTHAQDRGARRASTWPRATLLCFEHLDVREVDGIARSLVPREVVVHTDARTNCLVLVGVDDVQPMSQVLDRLERRAAARARSR